MYIDKLTGEKKRIIGICVCGIQEENVHGIVKSIRDRARECGIKVLVFAPFDDMYVESLYTKAASSVFSLVNTGVLDALVVLPESIKSDSVTERIISDAKKLDIPVISIDRTIDSCSSITFDYVNTFEKIVRHIIEYHKCRRVNFVAGFKDNPFSDERIAVYKRVLEENGIPFEEKRLGYGDFWTKPTEKVVNDFLSSGEPLPEAIICCNDTMAIAACQVLRKNGYSVPEDILVTGFDGITLQKYYLPNITTAAPDIDMLGQTVVDIIERAFAGERKVVSKVIPYRVDFSESCGCKKHSSAMFGDKILELYDMTTVYDQHEKHMFGYNAKSVDCKDLDDITELMASHADYHYTWCCINSDFLSQRRSPERFCEDFTKHMILLAELNGMKKRDDRIEFPVTELLPDFLTVLEKHDSLLFSPVHFIGEVIGYLVIDFDDDSLNLKNTHRFISITNQILENYKSRINLERTNAVLEDMHIRDALTGSYNRRGFYKNALPLIRKNRAKKLDTIVFSIDMDGLKFINDTFGHSEGDRAIKIISDTLVKCAGEEGVCARFGGDEFSVIVTAEGEYFGDKLCRKFAGELDKYNLSGRLPYMISISCGYEIIPPDGGEDIDEALRKADITMYKIKRLKKKDGAAAPERTPMHDNYRNRLTQLLLNDGTEVYFYINYAAGTWTTASNSYLLPIMNSDEFDPIEAILESGKIYAEDAGNFYNFLKKIRAGVSEGIDDDKLEVAFRLLDNSNNEWYRLTVLFMKNGRKITEAVGHTHKLNGREVMEKMILSNYMADKNPVIFETAIRQRLDYSENEKFVLIQFDIAKFKAVNEVYGHEAGDELISHIGDVLKSICSDREPNARLGSDVFMLLTTYETDSDIIRFIKHLEKSLLDYKGMMYTFTFGVYKILDKSFSPRFMSDCATIARNSAKGSAVRNISFFSQMMKDKLMHRKFIEDMMQVSLDNHEFKMFLQPKVDISSGRIIGAEALVRWRQSDGTLMQPGSFIPVLEQNGFIMKIDEYMWECACAYISERLSKGRRAVPVSVNVSRLHLVDSSYIEHIDALRERYGVDKKFIELEITETIENINSNKAIAAAKAAGYKLLMDDFGSGYSSLGTLKSTPFDVLKLDTNFLSSSMTSERGKKIIEHTISMSKDIGLDIIAEGVETREDAVFLASCGCDAAQGFFYSRPITPMEFSRLLDEDKCYKVYDYEE